VAESEPLLFEEPVAAEMAVEAPADEADAESPAADAWFDDEAEDSVDLAAEIVDTPTDDEGGDLLAAESDLPEPVEPFRAPIGIRSVSWPQFIGQTSELIDRPVEGGSLFARIAAQKEALVEMGVVGTGKRLMTVPQVAEPAVAVLEPVVAIAEPVIAAEDPTPAQEQRAEANEQIRIDLMGMRVRLIEDETSAREIADTLEEAIAGGLQSPLALRVLGEAYLKLGMVERAAAQFRQAMLTRRRGG
jgi:hypothetical protein